MKLELFPARTRLRCLEHRAAADYEVGGVCQYTAEQKSCDVDQLAGLVLEVVPHHSCLVFCPTKKNCENVAQLICRFMSTSVESACLMTYTCFPTFTFSLLISFLTYLFL